MACLGAGGICALSCLAQTNPPVSSQDPLMSLLLAQPKIEIATNVVVTAAFDPPEVRPGETAFYRVSFNALEESIEWPQALTSPKGLELRRGSSGQMFQMVGGELQPKTTFIYRVRGNELGRYTLEPFRAIVYGRPVEVPAATLSVAAQPASGAWLAQELAIELPVTNLYIGETIRPAVVLLGIGTSAVQGFGQVQLYGEGWLVSQTAASQRLEPRKHSGTNIMAMVHENALTALRTGKLKLAARAWVTGVRTPPASAGNTPPASPGPVQYTLVDAESVEVLVQPLPGGALPGFTGAIGKFELEPPALTTNLLRVGDPVTLRVQIHGSGNLGRLVAPPAPKSPEWQVLGGKTEPANSAATQGTTTLVYTLIPLTEHARRTPPIPFSYFDTRLKRYCDLTVPAIKVSVEPAILPSDPAVFEAAERRLAPPEKEMELSDLADSQGVAMASLSPLQQRAWFPLIQLMPGVAFAGLWLWDRRRTYLETHPDVVLRRKARAALRQWRKKIRRAVETGDSRGYAAAAVNAMRAACAPHFPADARALVGADVLSVLGEAEQQDGSAELIRRFFEVADADRYAAAPARASELVALRPTLERVLDRLANRL